MELKKQVARFLDEKLSPLVEECDEKGIFPEKTFRDYFSQGFGTSFFPEEFGGNGDLREFLNLAEEMGRVDMGFALSALASSILFGNNVLKHGTPEQKKKYLIPLSQGLHIGCWALTEPAGGSDAVGIKSTAEKSGENYILNGSKTFITNAPVADTFIVLTRLRGTESQGIKGGCAFILEKGMKGLSTGRAMKKMGHRSSPTGEVFLENCIVPKSQLLGAEGLAFIDMKKSLDIERASFSAIGIGLIDEVLSIIIKYASTRTQFGQSLLEFQLIQEKIAGIVSQFELLKSFAKDLVEKIINEKNVTKDAAILKLELSRLAVRATDEAIQILGGYGYMTEYQVERFYRDAKLYEIGGGTSEIQKLIIAKETIKEYLR